MLTNLGVRALVLIALVGCSRSMLGDPNDASIADASVLDTGIDNDGPILGEVSIATWNLEQFPKTATTANLVHDILLSVAPDLIGVEEISDPIAFRSFAQDLTGYRGVEVDDPSNFLRVGLLYREDRVQVGDVRKLFEDDGYAFPRPPLAAQIAVTSTSGDLFDFTMVVVHLKAQSDIESRERRRAANEMIDEWIHGDMASTGETDYVVVGDFNDRLSDPPGENVFAVYLDQPQLYYFLTTTLAAEGEYSYIPFPGLIDHVLITTDALYEYGDGTTEVLHLDESIGGYQSLISDHRPVVSHFKIRAR